MNPQTGPGTEMWASTNSASFLPFIQTGAAKSSIKPEGEIVGFWGGGRVCATSEFHAGITSYQRAARGSITQTLVHQEPILEMEQLFKKAHIRLCYVVFFVYLMDDSLY